MRSRTTLLIICSAVLAVAFVTALLVKDKETVEPQYNGRSLSEWYEQWSIAYSTGDREKVNEASQAISHIGTNALPFLLKCIAYTPSKPGKVITLFYKMPIVGDWVAGREIEQVRQKWQVGMFLMSRQAAPAIPALLQLIYTTTDEDVRDRAFLCLRATASDEEIPVIAATLNNPEHPAYKTIVGWLADDLTRFQPSFKFSTNLAQIVPALVHCSTNEDWHYESETIVALGKIALAPELAVPALTKALQSSKSDIRKKAASALECFGPAASNSIPALTIALNDPDDDVRAAATNALLSVSGTATRSVVVE